MQAQSKQLSEKLAILELGFEERYILGDSEEQLREIPKQG
jgi:hypothetical protein